MIEWTNRGILIEPTLAYMLFVILALTVFVCTIVVFVVVGSIIWDNFSAPGRISRMPKREEKLFGEGDGRDTAEGIAEHLGLKDLTKH